MYENIANLVYEYIASLLAQSNFDLTLSVFSAALLAYTFATVLHSWMAGAALFPGLAFGSLVAIDLAKDLGLVVGRDSDKDLAIICACVAGLMVTLVTYYVLFIIWHWLISYNRSAHRALLERAGDRR